MNEREEELKTIHNYLLLLNFIVNEVLTPEQLIKVKEMEKRIGLIK